MSWIQEYQPLIGVRLNMVATPSGEFFGPKGSSREISNELDRSLIIKLRRLSDVYVTGGNTFRSEGYKAPTSRALAVITRHPDNLPEGVIGISSNSSNLAADALKQLKELGFERVLLEVGPSLAVEFFKENAIDEFCLTLVGGTSADAASVAKSLGCQLQLESEVTIEGTLFTRWRRGND